LKKNINYIIGLALVLLSIFLVFSCSGQKNNTGPKIGRAAPELSLTGVNGNMVRLSDLRGKVVLLNFWASWCPPCREEIPSLVALLRLMEGKNFRMLTVAVDQAGRPAIEAFFRKTGVSIPAYPDPAGVAAKPYGITGVPETFIIDKSGILRKKFIGPLDWSSREIVDYLVKLSEA
jgi:cytochrome c biogenesis protein CcmG, thiol:disulfide interchange protein DsbE